MVSLNICSISIKLITFQYDADDDDDGNVTVSDERLTLDFKYDGYDNVNHHFKKMTGS